MATIDLTGKTFGQLTAIRPTNQKYKRSTIWECQCACGNIVLVPVGSLKSANTKSCGCLTSELSHNKALKMIAENKPEMMFQTNISKIRHVDHIQKNNKSGIRGVCWRSDISRWRVSITFQKNRYNLGNFKVIEDAAKIRKQAEERIFGGFLDWYDALTTEKQKEGE